MLVRRNLALAALLSIIALTGGCGSESDGTSTSKPSGDATSPQVVEMGQEVQLGSFTLQEGWKLFEDRVAGWTVFGTSVKHEGAAAEELKFAFKLYKDDSVVVTYECESPEMEGSMESRTTCSITGDFEGEPDRITIERLS